MIDMETTRDKEIEVSPVVAKTMQNALRAAHKTGETYFIVPTANGPRITQIQPKFTSYYKVEADDVTFIAYEPWNA